MNKIILYSQSGMDIPAEDLRGILDVLDGGSPSWTVNTALADALERRLGRTVPASCRYDRLDGSDAADSIMICLGGDGTFLDTVRLVYGLDIPILGLNYGHLGFLANTPRSNFADVLDELAAGRYSVLPRTLLEAEGDFGREPLSRYALNEFSLHRTQSSMTWVEVWVDGDRLTTYRGDGVLLCTPTGSTAYSLSLGGPIVAPQCGCFVISPIASHNLTMRPVVIPDTSTVRFRLRTRDGSSTASLDNRSWRVDSGAEFEVRKAASPIFIANLQNISFYDTLRNKMMWGVDGWEAAGGEERRTASRPAPDNGGQAPEGK